MTKTEKLNYLLSKAAERGGSPVEMFIGNEGKETEFYVFAPEGLGSDVLSIDDEEILAGSILYAKNHEDVINEVIIAEITLKDLESADFEAKVLWEDDIWG